MNNRIHQLHEEAMKSCDEHRSDTLNYHRIYREKFAELIVRECANFVEDTFDFVGEEIIVKEKMLEHFGVEE